MKTNKLKDVLRNAKMLLKNKGIDTYSIDSEVLLMHTIGFNKVELFTKDDYLLKDEEIKKYNEFINRRILFEPVQYLTGKCEFMSMDFVVNKNTLIPRPDTEIVVENAIEFINKNNYKNIIDIGTGCGIIAVSIAKYCLNTNVTAVDISEYALNTAKQNALNNNVYDKINFVKSNIFSDINDKYDVIISNPPYIESDTIQILEPQVKNFEPIIALDGGKDGLYFYNKISNNAYKYIKNGGMIFFEIGYNQAYSVFNILARNNFKDIKIIKDLSSNDRVVFAKYSF